MDKIWFLILTCLISIEAEINLLGNYINRTTIQLTCISSGSDESSNLKFFKGTSQFGSIEARGRISTIVDASYATGMFCRAETSNKKSTNFQLSAPLNSCKQGYYGRDCNLACSNALGLRHAHCEGLIACSEQGCKQGCPHVSEHYTKIPDQIRNLKSISTSKSITVTWDNPIDNFGLSRYLVKYRAIGKLGCEELLQNTEILTSSEIRNNSVLLGGLRSFTLYSIEVVAINLYGDQNKYIYSSTKPSEHPTETILNHEVVDTNYRHVVLKWDKPFDCNQIHSKLTYGVNIFSGNKKMSKSTENEEIVLDELLPNKMYKIEISIIRKTGRKGSIFKLELNTTDEDPTNLYYLLYLLLLIPIVGYSIYLYKKRIEDRRFDELELAKMNTDAVNRLGTTNDNSSTKDKRTDDEMGEMYFELPGQGM